MKITSHLFEAFLKCPTKCYLRSLGEAGSGNEYADWVRAHEGSYEREAARRLQELVPETERVVAPSATENLKAAQWQLAVDVELRADRSADSHVRESQPNEGTRGLGGPHSVPELESRLHAIERLPSEGRGKPAQFIPIRFIFRNKLSKDDRLLLAFDALVLSQVLGREVSLGKIIHGDDHATLKVRLGARTAESARTAASAKGLLGEVRKQIEKITTLLSGEASPRSADSLVRESPSNETTRGLGGPRSGPTPPDLVLNRHCAECEFRRRCRQKALETDDLSLLAGMSAKERQKLRSKGIFTVTQLSYTFRPRRRPKRLRDKREKYHHALKALAIREKKIHIVGSPELKIEGTPVYLDVEGLPDRDFYYLIGLRIGHGESAVQHSLWADTVADEGKIWREFLGILETVEKPVLIHYGSYETTFLKRMGERYGDRGEDSIVTQINLSRLNLVSFLFGRIYFPTISNGLKEIAGWLGFKWFECNPSGALAICLRCDWEQFRASTTKERLIKYNGEDCVALEILTNALSKLIGDAATNPNVDFADVPKAPATVRGKVLHDCFGNLLKAAHANYKSKKISVQSPNLVRLDDTIERKPRKQVLQHTLPARGGRRIKVPRKRTCQRHPDHPTSLKSSKRESAHALLDVTFAKGGCKKGIVRYVGHRGYCPHCHSTYPPPAVKHLRGQFFGFGFQAWAVYLRVALRLSVRLIAKATRDLLHEDIPFQSLLRFVEQISKDHRKTEEALLRAVLQSATIHIDETKMNILGVQQFVWVLTDGIHVAFHLTPGRETDFLHELLAQYKGTVVSDFYGGYDALRCRQQKCLVHLIRDLNDDLWSYPFDEEYEEFVLAVRDLIVPMIEDVERFGLKSFHLRKHARRVDRFYNRTITGSESKRELILKYKKRFQRYKDSLFTFLEHDGVSWNNNAAERAIRHLAVQRKVSGAFTTKGANHYLRLLAIAQTCRFQEKSFLGFLLSGLKNVDAYKESQRRRRRQPVHQKRGSG